MVSITAELLDACQDIPWGTPAHDKSYGRRNPSEKTISMIKNQRRPQRRMVPGFRSRRPHHRNTPKNRQKQEKKDLTGPLI